ncbi:MAG: hypothetical protein RL333_46 [Pseudomonadota bacterium]|jgi:predicted double-glycine peptidase
MAIPAEPVHSLTELRQKNVMMQKWDISCGAAAIGTILRYHHGLDISEKDIAISLMQRDEYIKNPQLVRMRLGFSLLDIKRYVESVGYIGLGLGGLQLADLIERAPVMVTVVINGYNHFVVFRGIKRNRVLLADPAWGNRTLTVDQFMDMWAEAPKIGRVGLQIMSPINDEKGPESLNPQDTDFISFH